jgi:membrane protease YdiL (CAAX protease family)
MSASPRDAESPQDGGPPTLPAILRVVLYLLLLSTLIGLVANLALRVVAPDVAAALAAGERDVDIPLDLALMVQAALLPLILLVTAFFVRRIDGGSLADIGLGRITGLAQTNLQVAGIAMLVPMAWLGLAAFAGGVRFGGWHANLAQQSSGLAQLVTPLLYGFGFLVAALAEETVLRGYVYGALASRYRWINAAGASAALFALLHFGNPGVGPVALLNTFLIGLLLAALRRTTGSIYPGAIAHAVWNFALGCLLAQPLSGIAAYPIFDLQLGDGGEIPVHVSGGAYGPEASILITSLLVPLVFLIVMKAAALEEEDETVD